MNCSDWELQIAGASEAAAGSALERHLEGCAECRRFAFEIEANRRALAGMNGRAEMNIDRAADAVRGRVLASLRSRRRGAIWMWAAAACIAALCAPVALINFRHPLRNAPPLTPAAAATASTLPGPAKRPSPAGTNPAATNPAGTNPAEPQNPIRVALHRRLDARARRPRPPLMARAAPETAGPVVIKMLTEDPNVVIIWIADRKGESL